MNISVCFHSLHAQHNACTTLESLKLLIVKAFIDQCFTENLCALKHRFHFIRLTLINKLDYTESFWGEKTLSVMEISHQREPALLVWYRSVPLGTKKKKI